MSFSIDDPSPGEQSERPMFFDLQEKVALLLEELHEAGASTVDQKAQFLALLVANHWTAEEYGIGLLLWLNVTDFQD
ncbi:MAG: hypothetical protein E6R04_01945 [Spirochaetes bacterium]|nr:MAG: hypothetical protein E6R04_01945 [Spirochaetota bacterium]